MDTYVCDWLMLCWGLERRKSVGQTSKLEIQVEADVAVLSLQSTGQASRLETSKIFMLQS